MNATTQEKVCANRMPPVVAINSAIGSYNTHGLEEFLEKGLADVLIGVL